MIQYIIFILELVLFIVENTTYNMEIITKF